MINADNLDFVEDVLREYQKNPAAVDPAWRSYFEKEGINGQKLALGPSYEPSTIFNPPVSKEGDAYKQERVDQLIRAYRVRGHRTAWLDPLGSEPAPFPELQLSHYGLTEADLSTRFWALSLGLKEAVPLQQILQILQNTYCRAVGVQYMHIDDPEPKFWLQQTMETTQNVRSLSHAEQIRILTRLTDAEMFEEFIAKKYVGAKRFGLEGAESLIPLLDLALEDAGEFGIEDIVIGMAHRGRLNVMANIMQKDPGQIFREFDDTNPELHFGRGDVKYHLGYSSVWTTSTGKKIDLALCFNPSHLEFVGPVVMGRVRARQEKLGQGAHQRVMGLIIHGDAAFAGQGVVQEMLNLSEIAGYSVGGTIHIIVNNQVGFTTSPRQARSGTYPTDVAKMLQIPIIHVNGEHPEAVAQAIRLAMEYRKKFNKDVVVDMWCYRRRGHNEGDDPTYTQPLMYKQIARMPSVRERYVDSLMKVPQPALSRAEIEDIASKRREYLEAELAKARAKDYDYKQLSTQGGYRGGLDKDTPEVATEVDPEKLASLLVKLTEYPEGFTPNPKLQKMVLDVRKEMAAGNRPLDWGAAENLAYASLVVQGIPVRLTGQDVGRGTFSHRHAIFHDYENGQEYIPLAHLSQDQARYQVWDSPLTETAVLAFEYGVSLDRPECLVLWEAQFGDFVNVAQVIIDQFIVSSEDKWSRLNGLVMLLPHGFEGQGPEHSSARLERFLGLAAEDNIQVVNLTTPGQLFHCLRRQVLRPLRKPLVIMSPKSLLRHPECVTPLKEMAEGSFQRVLPDTGAGPSSKVQRVLLCSGKLYYELDAYRKAHNRKDVAIVRVEQLYPFPDRALKSALSIFPKGTAAIWVQEEPANMGALPFLRCHFDDKLYDRYPFMPISRPESASPATGSGASHKIEQASLIEQAFKMAVPT
ncbi:MAG: 2-oxoglutarate dehydrogenase E1 component [Candidatus Eremiobacteraeota bacterium]|nr:2-oxoglutarate dehydrogenase E1 component [Candidatus Eremiobacteraeota bacterium]MCW5868179.1 2-oxoglutarate dehydrogenase E1 component [Candidatus Eremiobacteraeota bacterium]